MEMMPDFLGITCPFCKDSYTVKLLQKFYCLPLSEEDKVKIKIETDFFSEIQKLLNKSHNEA